MVAEQITRTGCRTGIRRQRCEWAAYSETRDAYVEVCCFAEAGRARWTETLLIHSVDETFITPLTRTQARQRIRQMRQRDIGLIPQYAL